MDMKVMWLAFFLASLPIRAQDTVALGKQRAAASPLAWEIGDGSHPVLGPIRFAVLKTPIATPVGSAHVSSRVYVSCERNIEKIAIEIANGTAADDPGGLHPASVPRLVCHRAGPGGARNPVREDLIARWEISDIGDVLSRGFRPSLLRQCVSIGVVQEVVLPKGWARTSARIEFEIAPYNKELDSIFMTCGEPSAYAAQSAAPVPASEKPKREPDPVSTREPPRGGAPPWKRVRTTSSGRTNLRARPSTDAPLVGQLPPGSVVLAQPAQGPWWRVKASSGKAVEGYVREDRLVFK